jgi:hypothetical protein
MKKDPEKQLTTNPSQSEVVTLAVYLLGHGQRAIDTEDVAVEAHRLAPGRFSWKKYPDQINLELIRVYLSDAKIKSKLLIGSGRAGWRLTQTGLKWAQQVAHDIENMRTSRTRAQLRSGSIDEQRYLLERKRLLSTDAWKIWKEGRRDIPVAAAKEVFRIDSYATGDLRETKIIRVRSLFTKDDDLRAFLDHIIGALNQEGTR